MNKVVTDGLVLMPPPFADGLNVWSKGDGTPGTQTWDGASNGALVPSDPDFGACLEVQKTNATLQVRYMGETPILRGCYVRVTARVKAMSGNLPTARIGAWAGNAADAHVGGLTEQGAQVSLTAYGDVVEVTAIIGTGYRTGVDMPWGITPVYGHFGIDLTGPTGGIIRIDDIKIEDVTSIFHRKMMDWVDVKDFGAKGDGVADDSDAFREADDAANGRRILVPEGLYRIGSTLSIASETRFEGTLTMADDVRLQLLHNFDLDSYMDAFGDEVVAFKKAIQALFNDVDHEALDLCGRSIALDGPIDVQAAVDNKTGYSVRAVVRNGQFVASTSTAWDSTVKTSSAKYLTTNKFELTNVTNISQIPVGSLVSGNGVGREVYVKSVDLANSKLTLSQPLYDAVGTQTFTFTRFKYMLDFSGFSGLSKFVFEHIDFRCAAKASAILLPPDGDTFSVRFCDFTKPKDRGITSIGTGCQGMNFDNCNCVSADIGTDVPDRTTVMVNVNGNDNKIRDNRVVRFKHFAVLNGAGHTFNGNHWFQDDSVTDGTRTAGIVFTQPNIKSQITGNYCDNSFVEWTNEHDPAPEFASEFTFGGLTITGNIFTVNDVGTWFRFIVIKPYGPDHYIHGLTVSNNVFKSLNGWIDRVEKVDDTFAPLDAGRYRKLTFDNNTYNSINQVTISPVQLEFERTSPDKNWVLDFGDYLPFGGHARRVESAVPEGKIKDASGTQVFVPPSFDFAYGVTSTQIRMNWPFSVTGTMHVTVRADKQT